jgi:hypothetical protein
MIFTRRLNLESFLSRSLLSRQSLTLTLADVTFFRYLQTGLRTAHPMLIPKFCIFIFSLFSGLRNWVFLSYRVILTKFLKLDNFPNQILMITTFIQLILINLSQLNWRSQMALLNFYNKTLKFRYTYTYSETQSNHNCIFI